MSRLWIEAAMQFLHARLFGTLVNLRILLSGFWESPLPFTSLLVSSCYNLSLSWPRGPGRFGKFVPFTSLVSEHI